MCNIEQSGEPSCSSSSGDIYSQNYSPSSSSGMFDNVYCVCVCGGGGGGMPCYAD